MTGWVVAGAGWVARDHMAPALETSPTSTVVAVLDADLAAAARLAARFPGAVATTDLDAALSTRGAEAVYVATPNHAHRPVVEAALHRGLAVLCEKPLAATVDDADAMALASRGHLAASAYDQRWHPAHRRIAAMVATGELGMVTAVRIVYGCWLPPTWLPPGDSTGENWRADPARAGGGAYIDLAPHGLDLVGTLLGEDVVAATARLQRRVHDYPVDDGAVLTGETATGVLLSQHVSYNTPDELPRRRLEVVGTRGQLVAVDTMGQTPGGSLTFLDARDGSSRDIPFDPGASPFALQLSAFERAVRGEQAWTYPLERDAALLHLLHDAVVPSRSEVAA